MHIWVVWGSVCCTPPPQVPYRSRTGVVGLEGRCPTAGPTEHWQERPAPAGLGNHERIHRPWTREAAYGNRTRVSGLGSPRSAIGPMRHEVQGWNRTSDVLPCPAAPESAGGSALPLDMFV